MKVSDRQAIRWLEYAAEVGRRPEKPFPVQWERFNEIFADRDPGLPPPPVWIPDRERLVESNLAVLMRELDIDDYSELHRWSVEHRSDFWQRAIERLGIDFTRRPDRILDLSDGPTQPRWLPEAELNIVSSCFQPPDCTIAVAIGREGSDTVETITYGELEALVNRVANGLVALRFSPGDAIALYMPMNLECVAAYLGIIRAGCIVVSIADSFAPSEIARRLEIADTAGIITVDQFARGGRTIPLYEKVREAGAARAIVITEDGGGTINLRPADLMWRDFLSNDAVFNAAGSDPYAVTNILFSSGTTGDPKAIPWTHLTPIKAAMDGHFHQRGRLADQHRLDDGAVADLRHAHQPRVHRPVRGSPIWPRLHRLRAPGRGQRPRGRALSGAGVEGLGRLRRHRLVDDSHLFVNR